MNNGTGVKLLDLANVLHAIAEANDDNAVLYVLPHAVGGFGQELLSSKALVSIPMLPDHTREKLSENVNKSIEEAMKSLDVIIQELCKNDKINYQKLMEATGSLFQHATLLSEHRRGFMPRHSSQRVEEE